MNIKAETPDPSSSWRSLIPVIKVNISTVSGLPLVDWPVTSLVDYLLQFRFLSMEAWTIYTLYYINGIILYFSYWNNSRYTSSLVDLLLKKKSQISKTSTFTSTPQHLRSKFLYFYSTTFIWKRTSYFADINYNIIKHTSITFFATYFLFLSWNLTSNLQHCRKYIYKIDSFW